MKDKIFMYWDGNQNKKLENSILNYNSKHQKTEIILGPSSADHEFLMKFNNYYKINYKNKLFALAADIWRIFIINKHGGWYFDALTILNAGFEEFIISKSHKQRIFFKTSKWSILNSAFKAKKNDPWLQRILDKSASFDLETDMDISHTAMFGSNAFEHSLKKDGIVFKTWGNEERGENSFIPCIYFSSLNKKKHAFTWNSQATWTNNVNIEGAKKHSFESYNNKDISWFLFMRYRHIKLLELVLCILFWKSGAKRELRRLRYYK